MSATEHGWDTIDEYVYNNYSFDEVAAVVVCMRADLNKCDRAKPVIESVMKKFEIEYDEEDKDDIFDEANRNIAWTSVYNQMFRDIVIDEYDFNTRYDRYGALCWVDGVGNEHCGDESGLFPLYMFEKRLREDLDEGEAISESEAEWYE